MAGNETTQRVEWYHSWRVALDNINIHVAYMNKHGTGWRGELNPRPRDYHIHCIIIHSCLNTSKIEQYLATCTTCINIQERILLAYTNSIYIWCTFKPSKPSPHGGVTWLPCRRVYYIVRQHTITAWWGPGLLFFVVLSCSLLVRHSLSSCRKTNVNPRDRFAGRRISLLGTHPWSKSA